MTNFTGTGGNDIWTGTVDQDFAWGGAGNDTLSGSDGDDIIAGEAGGDTLNGGDGNDTIYSDVESPPFDIPYYGNLFTPPVLDTGTAVDTIVGGAGSDAIFAGYGDNVDGGADGDVLFISFQGASTGVNADFSLGTITIGGGTITNIENLGWIEGSEFGDYIVATTPNSNGYSPFTAVFGMGGDDHLIAGYYTGRMEGGEGNDIVDGRNSQYLQGVYGNAGNDTLYTNTNTFSLADGGDGDDIIYSHGQTYGGAGNDQIYLQWSYYAGLVFGDEGDDVIIASDVGHVISGGAGADQLYGGNGDDQLRSDDYSDGITNDNALDHDILSGAGGNDYLWAGYGDDVDGGTGTDTLLYSFGGLTAGITFNTASIVSGQPFVLGGGTIQNVENLLYIRGTDFADRFTLATQSVLLELDAGAGNDTITIGNSSAAVYGGDGNDRIFSGAAADEIHGGAGRDIVDYRFYASGVTVDLAAGTGAGGDTISEVESVLGSEFADTIQGDANANTLMGMAGNDVLNGRDGNDALTGGAGYDQMYGGAGDDLYYVNDDGDIAIESAGEGYDTVKSTISLTLTNNIERLVLGGTAAINGTGNSIDNNLTGNSAANTLLGLGGADFIIGGGGLDQLDGGEDSDTYYFASFEQYADATITDSGVNFGWDVVRFAGTTAGTLVMQASDTGIEEIDVATSSGLTANFSGTTAINVDASALGSGVIIRGNSGANVLTGTAFNDNLHGNNGNDHLIAGDFHDVLDGGRGNDIMEGGAGSDLYYVDSTGDSVVEAADGGNDAVYSTISYVLGATVENLSLLGTNDLSGTGNDVNNTLNGNAGDNILSGLGGMDYLDGGAGRDTLNGGADADWLIGGAGRDQLSGGGGGDYFNFDEGHFDGMTTNTCDRILDFSQVEGDRIRLEDMDANTVLGGEQAFSFIGSAAFHGVAGELRYFQSSGNTFVQGDLNGDGAADFMIRLDGVHTLTGNDFML